MKKSKIIIASMLAVIALISQIGVVFAAPVDKIAPLIGIVQSITLETDTNTDITTALVTIVDDNNFSQTVRLSINTASKLGLLTTDENGTPIINQVSLGTKVQINPNTVISDNGDKLNPVGDALATFFSGITDYETIMKAHEEGAGFGVIAQSLWLTAKLKGNSNDFLALLNAKETGNFSAFILQDGSIPKNWGQFKKAVLDGAKINNLGAIFAPNHNTNINGHNGNNASHSNNGNGNGNNGNGNNGNGNDNGK